MNTTTHTGTPLRQRMTEDMRMRKLEDKTQQAYIRAVRPIRRGRNSPTRARSESRSRVRDHRRR